MTQEPLPPLDPAARRDAALGALRLVAAHDGQWYWYQLDRALSADHPGPFFAEIDALAAAGLIEVRRVPEPGAVRYHLTARGASVLAGTGR